MTCNIPHTPNARTEASLWEGEANQGRRIIRALLDHAVYDQERNDECIEAVRMAKEHLDSDPNREEDEHGPA